MTATPCDPAPPPESLPNAWYAPGFSPVSEFRRMLAVLRGHGGSLEQSFLYFDHHSAMDWIDTA